MTEQIDYKEAWKNLLFDFSRMIVDDFDRFEQENNINIFEISDNILSVYDYYYKNIFYRFKHHEQITRIVIKNVDYILKNINLQDIKNLVTINNLRIKNIEFKVSNYSAILYFKIKEHFYLPFLLDDHKLNSCIIKKVNERGWICCGKRHSLKYYYRHLKSKIHSC